SGKGRRRSTLSHARVVPDESRDDALDRDIARVFQNRFHGGVGGLKTHARSFGVVALQRRFAAHERDDRLSILGTGAPGDDHVITIPDPVLHHGIAANAEDEVLPLAEKRRGDLDGLLVRERLDGTTGGDGSEKSNLARARGLGGGRDAATAVP